MAKVYGIWNDQQIPYCDDRAMEVATQVFEDAKLDCLVYNGDFADFRSISRYPVINNSPELISDMREELERVRTRITLVHKRIKPKRAKWNDGNHEYRVYRSLTDDRNIRVAKLLDLPEFQNAASIPTLLEFHNLKPSPIYSGTYPEGCWLDDDLPHEENVWVEHGYSVRKKSGYTISNLMDDRWASCIVGHVEKLAGPIWQRKMDRDYFGIENGNLSGIGETVKGKVSIYQGVPYSVPKFLNHRQGITLVYRDADQWWPFTIKIRDGVAWWNGRRYKA